MISFATIFSLAALLNRPLTDFDLRSVVGTLQRVDSIVGHGGGVYYEIYLEDDKYPYDPNHACFDHEAFINEVLPGSRVHLQMRYGGRGLVSINTKNRMYLSVECIDKGIARDKWIVPLISFGACAIFWLFSLLRRYLEALPVPGD